MTKGENIKEGGQVSSDTGSQTICCVGIYVRRQHGKNKIKIPPVDQEGESLHLSWHAYICHMNFTDTDLLISVKKIGGSGMDRAVMNPVTNSCIWLCTDMIHLAARARGRSEIFSSTLRQNL